MLISNLLINKRLLIVILSVLLPLSIQYCNKKHNCNTQDATVPVRDSLLSIDSLIIELYLDNVALISYSSGDGSLMITGLVPHVEKRIVDKTIIEEFFGHVDRFFITKSDSIYVNRTRSKETVISDYPRMNIVIHLAESGAIQKSVSIGEEGYDISFNPEFLDFIELLEILTSDGVPYQYVEEKPLFQDGDIQDFYNWLSTRIGQITIPKGSGNNSTVFLEFRINHEGKVGNAHVLKGINNKIDAEVVNTVSSSPDWSPGRQKGVPVTVIITIPISIGLCDGFY